jgi:hypothetical protein
MTKPKLKKSLFDIAAQIMPIPILIKDVKTTTKIQTNKIKYFEYIYIKYSNPNLDYDPRSPTKLPRLVGYLR